MGQWERARYKVPIWLDAELTKLEDMVDEMVEAMTSTIIESEKRTGEIPVQPRNERSVSILERVAAARAQYKLRSTGILFSAQAEIIPLPECRRTSPVPLLRSGGDNSFTATVTTG